MSLKFVQDGDMRDDPANILLCCVNCIPGILGAGQAKSFADRWPSLIHTHRSLVEYGSIYPGRGRMAWIRHPHRVEPGQSPLGIYLFPTKDHWRDASQLSWVADGLDKMVEDLIELTHPSYNAKLNIRSIAVPGLGCGLGGLPWKSVRPLIEGAIDHFGPPEWCPDFTWTVYLPGAERRAAQAGAKAGAQSGKSRDVIQSSDRWEKSEGNPNGR